MSVELLFSRLHVLWRSFAQSAPSTPPSGCLLRSRDIALGRIIWDMWTRMIQLHSRIQICTNNFNKLRSGKEAGLVLNFSTYPEATRRTHNASFHKSRASLSRPGPPPRCPCLSPESMDAVVACVPRRPQLSLNIFRSFCQEHIRTRVNFTPQNCLLCHLGLYQFDFDFELERNPR